MMVRIYVMRERLDRRGAGPAPLKLHALTLLFIIVSFMPLATYAASPAGNIKQGNRYYDQRDYDRALEQYEAAAEATPDSDIVNFNRGAAYYQKGRYPEAVEAFTKALNTEDDGIEADSLYNIANAKYKLGSLSAENDINGAIGLYRESLDYYKRAIELDEGNRDARYNHELVERELKVLMDRLKNQKQQQDKQENKKDEETQEEQNKQSTEAASGESKDEEKTREQQAGSEQDMKEEQGDQQQPAGENGEEEQQAARQEEKNSSMSPEEAQMLLEAFGEEEARDALNRRQDARYPGVLKDW